MTLSQNLRFSGDIADEAEFEHPAGFAFIRRLHDSLASTPWKAGEVDNWRDIGWAFTCQKGLAHLEVTFARIAPTEWLLQITPHRQPGYFARLLGQAPAGSADEVHLLASAIHRHMATEIAENPRWCWNNFPNEANATPAPEPFRTQAAK